MNTVETQHSLSKDKKHIIRYGPNDDAADKVENVKILFKTGEAWDMRQGIADGESFDRVTVIHTCDSLHLFFYVNDNELKNEIFVSGDEVRSIMVSHFVKGDKK